MSLSKPADSPFEQTTARGSRQGVHSPEQVVLELPIAGPTSRMLAYAVDVVCIATMAMAVLFIVVNPLLLLQLAVERLDQTWLVNLSDPEEIVEAMQGMMLMLVSVLLLVQLIAETAYFVFFETLAGGRSPGKMLVGLRVVTDSGMAVGLPHALARNLLRFIDILATTYLVGLCAMLLSSRNKRLGDLAAGTIVVRLDRPPVAAGVDDDLQPGDDVFGFDHAQSARIGPLEVQLARETLRRVQAGESGALDEILRGSVAALRARIGYDPIDPAQSEAFLRAVLRVARKRRGS